MYISFTLPEVLTILLIYLRRLFFWKLCYNFEESLQEGRKMLFSGKLNKLRTLALGMVFIGVIIMYIGYAAFVGFLGPWFADNTIIMAFFLVLGFLSIIGSTVMYIWLGLVSTKATRVYCPKCGKVTKIVGMRDECMFCKQMLSLDPADAPGNRQTT